MKNIFKVFSSILLSFILVIQSFAVEGPTNLKLDSSNENSVNISWDTVENAFMYYVYYDKKSWLDSWYDMQTEFIEANNIEISELEVGSTYYFTVISVDQNWEESTFSNELVVDITDTNSVLSGEVNSVDFALDSIELISYDKLELDFTNNLENTDDSMREFKIVNKNDNLDVFEVLSNELNIDDNSKIELILDREVEIWNEYEVIIIAITSSNWNIIESWIDNTETFIVEEIIELNSATENTEDVNTEDTNTESTDLNAAAENLEDEVVNTTNLWPTWTNIDSSEVENTTLVLAENNSNLPKTWPEHILILILSIILWTFIFKFKRSK